MLTKLRSDLTAIMDDAAHADEHVHRPDHSSAATSRHADSPVGSGASAALLAEHDQRHVRTRLYFTSESHIYSLFNVLRWGTTPKGGGQGGAPLHL